MALRQEQLRLLHQALLDSYTTASLTQMVRFRLDEELEVIAGGENLSEIVFNLLRWAEKTGHLSELIEKASEYNPGNLALQEVVQQLQDSLDAPRSETTAAGRSESVGKKSPRLGITALSVIVISAVLLAIFFSTILKRLRSTAVAPDVTTSTETLDERDVQATPDTPSPTETPLPDPTALSTPIVIEEIPDKPLRVAIAGSEPCVPLSQTEAMRANLLALGAETYAGSIEVELLPNSITGTNDLSEPENHEILIWSRCSSDEHVDYSMRFLLIEEGKGWAQSVAELESLHFRLPTSNTKLAESIITAGVAYMAGPVERAALELNSSKTEWQQLDDPQERSAIAFLLGNSWLFHGEMLFDRAGEEFEYALAQVESLTDSDSTSVAMLTNNRGIALMFDTDYRAAQETFTEAIELAPNYVWAYINRSAAHLRQDQFEQAEADCQEASVRSGDQDFGPAYLCRAEVHYLEYGALAYNDERKDDALESAIEDAERAIEFAEDEADARSHLIAGTSHCLSKNTEQSILHLQRSLEIEASEQAQAALKLATEQGCN